MYKRTAVLSSGILRTGPWNLALFATENFGPEISPMVYAPQSYMLLTVHFWPPNRMAHKKN